MTEHYTINKYDKYPGSDSFSAQFLIFFWKYIGIL